MKMKISVVLGLVAIFFVLAATPLNVSNFTQVHIDRKPQGGTATPRLFVTNLDGPSDIIVAEDNATPVFAIRNGGAVEVLIGPFTNSGNQSITGILTVTGASKLGGNISSQTGSLTMTDSVLITDTLTISGATNIDGAADAIQLTVQGWTTQTTNLLVLEQSDGTDVTTVSNAGNADVAGTLQFGADNNYALGYASSTQEIACFTSSVTGTRSLTATGITTATFVMVTLITDPGAGAGAPFIVSADAPTTSTVTINVWQDDATAATAVATVHWCAVGDE
jgi:hypothetical protein